MRLKFAVLAIFATGLLIGGCITSSNSPAGSSAVGIDSYKTTKPDLYIKVKEDILKDTEKEIKDNFYTTLQDTTTNIWNIKVFLPIDKNFANYGNGKYSKVSNESENDSLKLYNSSATAYRLITNSENTTYTIIPDAYAKPSLVDSGVTITLSGSGSFTETETCLNLAQIPDSLKYFVRDQNSTITTNYNYTFVGGKINGSNSTTISADGKTVTKTFSYQNLGFKNADRGGIFTMDSYVSKTDSTLLPTNYSLLNSSDKAKALYSAKVIFSYKVSVTFNMAGNVTIGTITSGTESLGVISGNRSALVIKAI